MGEDAFLTALTARFDAEEERLRAVARRMLGGYGDVAGVLAEARAGVGDGVREWLAAVVGRACVRRLQGRRDSEPPSPPRATTDEADALRPTDSQPTGAPRAIEGVEPVWPADSQPPGRPRTTTDGAEALRPTDSQPPGPPRTTTGRADAPRPTDSQPPDPPRTTTGRADAPRPTDSQPPDPPRTTTGRADAPRPTDSQPPDPPRTTTGRADAPRPTDSQPPDPPRSSEGVDAVWLALLVVLDALGPDERLAYVLHELFGLPLDATARITGGTPEEAGRLARAARRRVRGGGPDGRRGPDPEGQRGRGGGPGRDPARQRAVVESGSGWDPARQRMAVGSGSGREPAQQRAVVESFLAAARARDPRALAALLHPDVVAHSAHGTAHGPAAVAEGAAAAFARTAADATRRALIDGAIGVVAFASGRPVRAVAFTLHEGRIVALDITTGEERVRGLTLAFPDA
ncbi:nuclear transport factor 2 family protein [Streptomyces sp. NPDC101160]|uniref:nuclear transport factor 2 family protein n=1 Tax=Streptomyces sp. NPDC101160 TaxID=3366118 RepID=UPI00381B8E6A